MNLDDLYIFGINVKPILSVFLVILAVASVAFVQSQINPLHTEAGGTVSLRYQEGHIIETVDFNEHVLSDLSEYLFFKNLDENQCYWIGKSFNRDAGLKLHKIGYVNSSIVLVQWNRDLQSVMLLRGEMPGNIFFVLILSVDW